MNILQELQQARSKNRNQRIIDFIGDSQEYFDELLSYFAENDARIQDTIAWIMSDCVQKNPTFLDRHFDFVCQNLKNPATNGVERNMYRALQYVVEIPEEYQGEIVELAFEKLSAANTAIANKVFSMTVVYNISKTLTELQQELAIMIEDQLPYGSAGFKNRGQKILNEIRGN